jgi:HK97 family phage prohead protease
MPATSTRRRIAAIACDRHRRIRLVASDAVVEAAAGRPATDRTLRGLALPYAADGRTSAGRVRASAGVVRWPADLRRVKVFTGHDRTRPVGYVTTLTETNDGLVAELHIAGTPDGDAALLEAREGTRDAMSVELEDVELDDDGELLAAELVAIALVPLPAFSDARIAAERGDDDDDDDDTDPPAPGNPPPAPAARRSAARAARAPAALTAARRRPQALTTEQAAAQIAAQFVDGGRTAAALNAALANITPTSTTSAATNPVQWLGELWMPELVRMNWAQSIQTATLTGMRLTGWKRVPPGPQISDYAGEKAPIPTDGALGFGPVNLLATRMAVGADFDRIWLDFGDESVINTWLRLVTQDYAKKLDAKIGTLILAEATDGGDAPTAIAAISLAARKLRDVGASVNWIALAADVMAEYLDIPTAEAPWWLASSSNVDLSGESATVNNLRVFESPALPLGTVTAGDRRAATQYTPKGDPFKVRAVDVADGGIDVGVFGYHAELINDPLGIVTVTVTPALP